jgi:hypothetical protein
MYSNMARQGLAGNKNATYALARGILGNVAIAGVGFGIPLAATLRLLYRELIPKEYRKLGEDPLLELQKNVPDEWKTLVTYGLSGALGNVGIGGSYSMEAPENFEDVLGIPVSMVKDIQQAGRALSVGDTWKFWEAVVPVKVARNILQAGRLMEEGQTTMGGQPVNVAGETEPMTISFGDAVKKSFGFQPLKMQEAWDYTQALQRMEETKKEKQSNIADRYTVAMRNNDMAGVESALDELIDWNEFWSERGVSGYLIDIRDSLESRAVVRQPQRRSAQAAYELVEEIMR